MFNIPMQECSLKQSEQILFEGVRGQDGMEVQGLFEYSFSILRKFDQLIFTVGGWI